MPEKWAADYPGHLIGPDELVINLTAQSLADEFLGRVCLTSPGEHCLLNQRIARLTPVLLPPRFLLCVFKSPWFRKFVASLNTGSLIQHMPWDTDQQNSSTLGLRHGRRPLQAQNTPTI
jgi:type I restriction enzyme S subunit